LNSKSFFHDLYPTYKIVITDMILLQYSEKGGSSVNEDLTKFFIL